MKFPGHVWKVIDADSHCVGMAVDSADLPPIPPGGSIIRRSIESLRATQRFFEWRKAQAASSADKTDEE